MGLPFIDGYKPRYNYQKQLIEKEISEYILDNKIAIEYIFQNFAEEVIQPLSLPISYDNVLDKPPLPSIMKESEPSYKPVKINYLKREQNNRTLGAQGEEFVIEFEKYRLAKAGKDRLVDKIEWVSKDLGDGLGYDILSRNENGTDRFIEVKTTKLSRETPIYISRTEVKFALKKKKDFYLYRVFNFNTQPQLFMRIGEYESFCKLIPQSYKGYF